MHGRGRGLSVGESVGGVGGVSCEGTFFEWWGTRNAGRAQKGLRHVERS
jgi:hypothetical protein